MEILAGQVVRTEGTVATPEEGVRYHIRGISAMVRDWRVYVVGESTSGALLLDRGCGVSTPGTG